MPEQIWSVKMEGFEFDVDERSLWSGEMTSQMLPSVPSESRLGAGTTDAPELPNSLDLFFYGSNAIEVKPWHQCHQPLRDLIKVLSYGSL